MSIESSLKDGRKLLIAHAEPADAAEIVAYINQISGESDNLGFSAGEFDTTVEDEAKFIAGLDGGKFNFMLKGVVEGRIVSTCNIHRHRRSRVLHIGGFSLSVARSHWGLGIGRRMAEAALDRARKLGVTKVSLLAREDNVAAIRLYESLGFHNEGINTRGMRIDGRYFDERAMGLWLD